jgi:hypothetical protein
LPTNNQADAKYIRISAAKGHLEGDRIFFIMIECWQKLIDQAKKWTGSKGMHDDYLDTVALAIQQISGTTPFVPRRTNATSNFLNILQQRHDFEVQAQQDSFDGGYSYPETGW